jgi:hypothetical protein
MITRRRGDVAPRRSSAAPAVWKRGVAEAEQRRVDLARKGELGSILVEQSNVLPAVPRDPPLRAGEHAATSHDRLRRRPHTAAAGYGPCRNLSRRPPRRLELEPLDRLPAESVWQQDRDLGGAIPARHTVVAPRELRKRLTNEAGLGHPAIMPRATRLAVSTRSWPFSRVAPAPADEAGRGRWQHGE